VLPIVLVVAPYVTIVALQTSHFAAFNKTTGIWTTGRRMMAGMPYEEASLLLGPDLEPLGAELSDYWSRAQSDGPHNLGEAAAFATYNARNAIGPIRWYLHQPLFGSWAMLLLIALGFLAPPWRRRLPYEALFVGFTGLVFVTFLSTPLFEERYLIQFVPFTAIWAGRGAKVLLGIVALPRALGLTAAVAGVAVSVLVTVAAARAAAPSARDTVVDRTAGAWIARRFRNAAVMDERTAITYYAHAKRRINFPWGEPALVLRYIARQDPDVLVLRDPPAQNVPYLATWVRNGVPDGAACLAQIIRARERSIYLYVRHDRERSCPRTAAQGS
jgi:hypothetical protein